MKFNFRTKEDKKRRYVNPHRWFAWHPVRVDDSSECRWLEYVVRSYPKAYKTQDGVCWCSAKYESLDQWLLRNPDRKL